MSIILSLDQSTSATKAVLFNSRGKVLDKASRSHQQIYPQPGWVEHDAEEIWRNVLSVIDEIAQRNRETMSRLAGLSITNQRETVLVIDRKTGKPLHHALVWQDRRGDSLCARLNQQGLAPDIIHKTGLRVDTYFSASKIRWLIENKPGLAAKLKRGDAVIGTIDAYLIHRLTNGAVFATDYTNASRTLLFDIAKLDWDDSLCRLFKTPMAALPEVRESTAHFGETNVNGIIPKCVPIIGVMGDSQASLFAHRCYEPGMAKATFGTGTSILMNIGDRFCVSEKGAVTALAWVRHGKPTYALEGLINYSAATIEWMKNQMRLIKSASEVERLALSVPDNGGVYFVPAFAGLSAPHWSPQARGTITGMTAFTQREHIVRAALEAIAYQIRDALDMMAADSGIKLHALHADGGPTRNHFLMSFTADVTRTPLRASHVSEASAWGAAMNGLLGLEVYRGMKELTALEGKTTLYTPTMKSKQVKQLHDGWVAAVKRAL